jgi:succinate dehydrogenase/fumarate reductase-like Fe-S protein
VRIEILNDREGVWRCRTIFNCTETCPREIRVTKAIGEVKKSILKGSRDIPVRLSNSFQECRHLP